MVIKKEYSTEDRSFPLDGKAVRFLIKNNKKKVTYTDLGKAAGVERETISSWINNRSLAPKARVLLAFKQLGITEETLHMVILERPSEKVFEKLQHHYELSTSKAQRHKNKLANNVDSSKDNNQNFDLIESINQVKENQKAILSKMDSISKQIDDVQGYSATELHDLWKALDLKVRED